MFSLQSVISYIDLPHAIILRRSGEENTTSTFQPFIAQLVTQLQLYLKSWPLFILDMLEGQHWLPELQKYKPHERFVTSRNAQIDVDVFHSKFYFNFQNLALIFQFHHDWLIS